MHNRETTPGFGSYVKELARDIVSIPFKVPTYLSRLRESLQNPQTRGETIYYGLLSLISAVCMVELSVIGVQNPEIGKRLLLATGVGLVLAIPASYMSYKSNK